MDMVREKNDYLYAFVVLLIVRHVCPCLLLVWESAGINISLCGRLSILYIIV